MMPKGIQHRKFWRMKLTLLALVSLCGAGLPAVYGGSRGPALGTVSGLVKDNKGNPLAGVVIALLKEGASEIVKQTLSGADGSFTARIAPGRYSLRAQADGFNPASFPAVQIRQSDELSYRFNLIPVGSGRTTAERRTDRDSSKWRLRAAQGRRSIFQAQEGEDETIAAALETDESEAADNISVTGSTVSSRSEWKRHARTEGVVETYAVASSDSFTPGSAGINFAFAKPAGNNVSVIFAGQFGAGAVSAQRLETTVRWRVNDRHSLSFNAGGMRLGLMSQTDKSRNTLGQISLRAVDEWVVRDGVVIVYGLDYSRFVGKSNAAVVSPRLGLQFDANARTRLRAAYAPGGDETEAQSVVTFEDSRVVFKQPEAAPVALVDGRAVMEKSRRFEFGVERVLDNESSIEATAFFDTTTGRGVGLLSAPLASLNGEGGEALMNIANQAGAARGLRVVYSRRITQALSASAGYSFGRGQNLSPGGLTNPAEIFDGGFFQTVAAQLNADVGRGMRVQTVFRFSPNATVFAIDPFAGRLAVFDPSLSILITQELPSFGLPVHAEAVIDARNLLDTQVGVENSEKQMFVNAMRRSLRGGISVRF
jgi:hypothetical protein